MLVMSAVTNVTCGFRWRGQPLQGRWRKQQTLLASTWRLG